MLRIAVIEDNLESANKLKECINKYQLENDFSCATDVYSTALSFFADKKCDYDVIFMDIEMPGMNGLEACKKIRLTDARVIIVFVTSIIQYAVDGYSVNAFDCIIKPFSYGAFKIKMDRIVEKANYEADDNLVLKSINSGIVNVMVTSILYVEVLDHNLIFHFENQDIKAHGKLSDIEKKLLNKGFFLASRCYLINLKYVKSVNNVTLEIGDKGKTIIISRRRKSQLLKALTAYLGGA